MGRVMLAKVFGGLILVTLVTWAATLAARAESRWPGCGNRRCVGGRDVAGRSAQRSRRWLARP